MHSISAVKGNSLPDEQSSSSLFTTEMQLMYFLALAEAGITPNDIDALVLNKQFCNEVLDRIPSGDPLRNFLSKIPQVNTDEKEISSKLPVVLQRFDTIVHELKLRDRLDAIETSIRKYGLDTIVVSDSTKDFDSSQAFKAPPQTITLNKKQNIEENMVITDVKAGSSEAGTINLIYNTAGGEPFDPEKSAQLINHKQIANVSLSNSEGANILAIDEVVPVVCMTPREEDVLRSEIMPALEAANQKIDDSSSDVSLQELLIKSQNQIEEPQPLRSSAVLELLNNDAQLPDNAIEFRAESRKNSFTSDYSRFKEIISQDPNIHTKFGLALGMTAASIVASQFSNYEIAGSYNDVAGICGRAINVVFPTIMHFFSKGLFHNLAGQEQHDLKVLNNLFDAGVDICCTLTDGLVNIKNSSHMLEKTCSDVLLKHIVNFGIKSYALHEDAGFFSKFLTRFPVRLANETIKKFVGANYNVDGLASEHFEKSVVAEVYKAVGHGLGGVPGISDATSALEDFLDSKIGNSPDSYVTGLDNKSLHYSCSEMAYAAGAEGISVGLSVSAEMFLVELLTHGTMSALTYLLVR